VTKVGHEISRVHQYVKTRSTIPDRTNLVCDVTLSLIVSCRVRPVPVVRAWCVADCSVRLLAILIFSVYCYTKLTTYSKINNIPNGPFICTSINLVGDLRRSPRTVMDVQVATDEFLAGVGFSSWISESRGSSYFTSISVTTTFNLTPTLYKMVRNVRIIKRCVVFLQILRVEQ